VRGTLGAVWLVAGRELRQRVRTRSFMLFTVFIAVAVVGSGVLFRVVADRDDGATEAVVAVGPGAPDGFTDELARIGTASDLQVTTITVTDRGEATTALDDGQADAAVLASTGSLLYERSISATLQAVIGAAWQVSSAAAQAEDLGLSADQVTAILEPPALEATALEQDDDGSGAGTLVGFGSAVLLFIFVSTFGGYVLSGVVEEKTSAVVEVLLAHVRADQLLAGKVLGLGLAALVQLGVAIVAGAVALVVSGADIPSDVWVALPTIAFWFIAGFALYSTLFALAGSFVSRPEDAQAAAAPISICVLGAYVLVFVAGSTPDGTFATVLSLLPPFAPLMMPLRIATGAATVPEVALATVLLVASAYGVLHVAGRIYARTLLHRGSRLPWRAALRLRQD
jgi:ABC-2 type transport system permease protein